ncbi:CLUMA_CG014532, isoform A [Clunio marinus]|uniref:CLUMA_CG014532, isoform A n=1 Tax=Clunio marinus TaxID=568069 RepID=A0A1J1IMP5_9DIPT|nr:CLUMA_CG014532, isoform A [Clunio marinus]
MKDCQIWQQPSKHVTCDFNTIPFLKYVSKEAIFNGNSSIPCNILHVLHLQEFHDINVSDRIDLCR